MSKINLSLADWDKAVRTIVGEASNQGADGMAAVAWVIRNRAEWVPSAWWGAHVAAVCSQPYAFSCWNPGDPNANRDRVKALATTDHQYRAAATVLGDVMAGDLPDPTGGATHYKVHGTRASWDHAVSSREPRQIGDHDFWRLAPDGRCLPFVAALVPAMGAAHG